MLKIKLRAREMLSGSYLSLALIILICVSISFLIANVQLPLSYIQKDDNDYYHSLSVLVCATSALAITVFVLPSLKLGREKWFFSRAKGNYTGLKTFFSCFGRNSMHSIAAWVVMRLLYFSWTAVSLLPALAVGYSTVDALKSGVSIGIGVTLSASTALLTICGLSFLFLITQRYFLVYYLIASSSISVIKAIRLSVKIMEGKCIKTAKFKLSFFPWLLSCIFILPIIYVWGYYKQSCACLAENFLRNLSTRPKAVTYGI